VKVLLNAESVMPAHTGAAGVAWWLRRGLVARGHSVEFYSAGVERSGPGSAHGFEGVDALVNVGLPGAASTAALQAATGRVPIIAHLVPDDLAHLGDPAIRRRLMPHTIVTHSIALAARATAKLGRPVRCFVAGAYDGPLPGGPSIDNLDDTTGLGGAVRCGAADGCVLWSRTASRSSDDLLVRALRGRAGEVVVAGTADGLPTNWGVPLASLEVRRLDAWVARSLAVVISDGDAGDLAAVAFAAGKPILTTEGSDTAAEVHAAEAGWVVSSLADADVAKEGLEGSLEAVGDRARRFFLARRTWDSCSTRYEEWIDEGLRKVTGAGRGLGAIPR
jgi:hypothetical protein